MADNLITADNASKDLLRSVLEAALIECSLDDDGDILAHDILRCFVLPDLDRRLITLRTYWGFVEGAPDRSKLEVANSINDKKHVVKASVTERGSLCVEYDLLLDGGLTNRAFAMAVKTYCFMAKQAVKDLGGGHVK